MAKILVVDDERDVTEMLRFFLTKQGHAVITASDGQEGLEMAHKETPDMIVLDVMMPEMDGFTMNSRLLEDPATRNIPILILTAKGRVREMFAMAHNVRCYIEKPFEPSDLLRSI